MNIRHFQAFVWLRWRIRVNLMKRGGIGNAIIIGFLAVSLAVAVVGLFIGSTAAGYFALGDASPAVLMYVWDGYIVGFLFCWMIGLISEMQRADTLSLDKFLHLPVSLKGAFLINYFGSLAGVTMALFAPMAAGLTLGLIAGRGPTMLLLIPLVLAFIFGVTAVTYLFQGWLASLMSNPRRRRTIITMLTLGFILIAQLPNLVNIVRPWGSHDARAATEHAGKVTALGVELQNKQITPDEYTRRSAELLDADKRNRETDSGRTGRQAEEIAESANVAFPRAGWRSALVGWGTATRCRCSWARSGYRRLASPACGGRTARRFASTPATSRPATRRHQEWRWPRQAQSHRPAHCGSWRNASRACRSRPPSSRWRDSAA